MTIDFSKMDIVVKEAIRQFLPPETLGKSAATSKLFQTIMNDKGTWMKMAKKLDITPLPPDSAKSEVITRLKRNAVLAKHVFAKTPGISTCKDPFQLNNLIQTNWPKSLRWDLLLETLIREDNEILNAKEEPDPTKLDAVSFLLKEGVMQSADKWAWERVFEGLQGVKKIEDNQYIYLPHHLPVFQTLMNEMMKSQKLTSIEKQEIMGSHHGSLAALNEKANYPYNYMEVMINAGWKPSFEDMSTIYTFCKIDLSGADPMAQRLKYATLLLKNSTKEEKEKFLSFLFENYIVSNSPLKNTLEKFLSRNFLLIGQRSLIEDAEGVYEYIHWPETEAIILGREIDSTIKKDQAERRQNILNAIEREEKNTLEQLKNRERELSENDTHIKTHAVRLKQAATL